MTNYDEYLAIFQAGGAEALNEAIETQHVDAFERLQFIQGMRAEWVVKFDNRRQTYVVVEPRKELAKLHQHKRDSPSSRVFPLGEAVCVGEDEGS